MSLGGIILCGGESRRMGCSKAWLPFGPERMLQRVVRLVGEAARPIIVVAAADQEVPDLPPGIKIVRDPIPGRGPLQGLATGLAMSPDPVDLVYATATDVPLLEPRWILRLAELIGDCDLAVPFMGGRSHPLAALYRKSAMLPVVNRLLKADQRRLGTVVDAARARLVSEAEMRIVDPTLGTIRNLNTPDDYGKVLRELGLDPHPLFGP